MSAKEKSQLMDEFIILKSLIHPNIVQYYDHDHVVEEHSVHLYMEYCDGGDLASIIRTCKETGEYVPESLVWSFFTQLVLALYRCHYNCDPPPPGDLFVSSDSNYNPPAPSTVILHRDIKPDNVFLDQFNTVKLGDFGLAKILDQEHFMANSYVGTPYYMSPEVLRDQPFTPQSDIWSLGCVIYELCAKHPPFQAKSHMQLAQKIKEGAYPPLPSVYSSTLGKTIAACLNRNFMQRPTTSTLLNLDVMKLCRKDRELGQVRRELEAAQNELQTKEQYLITQEEQFMIERENMIQQLQLEQEAQRMQMFQTINDEFNLRVEQEVERRIKMMIEGSQNNVESQEHKTKSMSENNDLQMSPHANNGWEMPDVTPMAPGSYNIKFPANDFNSMERNGLQHISAASLSSSLATFSGFPTDNSNILSSPDDVIMTSAQNTPFLQRNMKVPKTNMDDNNGSNDLFPTANFSSGFIKTPPLKKLLFGNGTNLENKYNLRKLKVGVKSPFINRPNSDDLTSPTLASSYRRKQLESQKFGTNKTSEHSALSSSDNNNNNKQGSNLENSPASFQSAFPSNHSIEDSPTSTKSNNNNNLHFHQLTPSTHQHQKLSDNFNHHLAAFSNKSSNPNRAIEDVSSNSSISIYSSQSSRRSDSSSSSVENDMTSPLLECTSECNANNNYHSDNNEKYHRHHQHHQQQVPFGSHVPITYTPATPRERQAPHFQAVYEAKKSIVGSSDFVMGGTMGKVMAIKGPLSSMGRAVVQTSRFDDDDEDNNNENNEDNKKDEYLKTPTNKVQMATLSPTSAAKKKFSALDNYLINANSPTSLKAPSKTKSSNTSPDLGSRPFYSHPNSSGNVEDSPSRNYENNKQNQQNMLDGINSKKSTTASTIKPLITNQKKNMLNFNTNKNFKDLTGHGGNSWDENRGIRDDDIPSPFLKRYERRRV